MATAALLCLQLACKRRKEREVSKQVVKEQGRVKWFNAAKGFGFIQRAGGEDVFVHHSAIDMEGYRTLEEGAQVEFETEKGAKGLQAKKVRLAE